MMLKPVSVSWSQRNTYKAEAREYAAKTNISSLAYDHCVKLLTPV